MATRRVLVTGGAGFLGSVLVPQLRAAGWQVRLVDLGWFGEHHPGDADLETGDIRLPERRWFHDVEAVVNLAGVSSDRLATAAPDLCWDVNAVGAARFAAFARAEGVRRFVQASTCSIYGLQPGGPLTEAAPARAIGVYAASKIEAERALVALQDPHFAPAALRFGTLHGWSPRMRTDLVVNAMLRDAKATGRIVVVSPGTWRPLLHVTDAARAVLRALGSDTAGAWNIAGRAYTIAGLGRAVAAAVPDATVGRGDWQDPRSYRVTGAAAARDLGFRPRVSIEAGIAASLARMPDGAAWAAAHRRNVDAVDAVIAAHLRTSA